MTRPGLFGFLLAGVLAGCGNPAMNGSPALDLGPGPDFSGHHADLAPADGGLDDGGLLDAAPPDLPKMDPGGPVITAVSPMANAVIQYDTLSITVTVTSPSAVPIASVAVTAGKSAPLSATGVANTWSGQLDLSALPPSMTTFTASVIATDASGKNGRLDLMLQHDHGPVITFLSPSKPTAHGSVLVEISVDDAFTKAPPASVSASIRTPGDVTLAPEAGTTPQRYSATVSFDKFMPPLDGPQLILAQATSTAGTVGNASKQLTVDNAGPSIVFVNPVAGAFIGGVLEIQATITDLSGVSDGTVLAVFGGNTATSVALTRVSGDSFHGFYDVRQLGPNYVLPSLSIRADDTLGNHGESAIEIVVDNVPPILSLDPPPLRVSKLVIDQATQQPIFQCSTLFDPVGDESADDLKIQKQVMTLKAQVEDQGNTAPGLVVTRISGLDGATVQLYVMPEPPGMETPMVVDTDGNGSCDDINPHIMPTSGMVMMSNQAVQLDLAPVTKLGAPDFVPDGAPLEPGCDRDGDPAVTLAPPALCSQSGTDMTYTLHNGSDPEPSIWTIPPVLDDAYDCVGLQFDSLNRLPEGPACAVVRAKDKTGNIGVSAPLRICVDRNGGLCPPGWQTTAPNCTGSYDKPTDTVSATACTPTTFQSGQVRNIDM